MVIMVILHLYVPLRLFINTHSPTSMHRNYFALGKTLFFTYFALRDLKVTKD